MGGPLGRVFDLHLAPVSDDNVAVEQPRVVRCAGAQRPPMAVRRWPRLGRSRASTSRSRISLNYRMIATWRLKEIENNWESELLPATVKLHIRFVVFGSSAWSSETEVSEPAADCGVLDRSPRPSRRELRPAGVDYSRESVYVQLRCNPRCGVFQGSSGLSNRGQGEIPSSGEGWAIAMSWPTLPLRTSEVHASIIEASYRDLATKANRRARRWTARLSQMWSARSCFETAFNSVRTWSIWL